MMFKSRLASASTTAVTVSALHRNGLVSTAAFLLLIVVSLIITSIVMLDGVRRLISVTEPRNVRSFEAIRFGTTNPTATLASVQTIAPAAITCCHSRAVASVAVITSTVEIMLLLIARTVMPKRLYIASWPVVSGQINDFAFCHSRWGCLRQIWNFRDGR